MERISLIMTSWRDENEAGQDGEKETTFFFDHNDYRHYLL